MHTAQVANRLSLSRGLFAILLFVLYALGMNGWLLFACAVLMWSTDALDGAVARFGIKRGTHQKLDGQMLDPMMDDAALFAGFFILLDSKVIPVWFVLLIALSRVMFSLVRQLGLAHGQRFARSQLYTKLSGASLASGQCILLINVNQEQILNRAVVFVLLCIMTVTLFISLYSFLVQQHRKLLINLLKETAE